MEKPIDLNELDEVVTDLKSIEATLVLLESSEYFKHSEDGLVFRSLRNSLENIRGKLTALMGDYYQNQE